MEDEVMFRRRPSVHRDGVSVRAIAGLGHDHSLRRGPACGMSCRGETARTSNDDAVDSHLPFHLVFRMEKVWTIRGTADDWVPGRAEEGM
jgi:hypothetical protein